MTIASPPLAADVIRLVVVSDLHVYSPQANRGKPSHVSTATPENSRQHPLVGLADLFKTEGVTANGVLCCGDLSDRADAAGAAYAWKFLPRIKEAVQAPLLAATCGNHDVDSRLQSSQFDPRSALQDLVPTFPLLDDVLSAQYWANHFVIVDQGDLRVLVLDTSAYHGIAAEQDHGRVAAKTVMRIRSELQVREPKAVNVLLCHHHPHKYGDVEFDDYSDMLGSYLLTHVLGTGHHGAWLIVHGHRHWPWLSYAAGGSASPVVFGAGSASAVIYPEIQDRVRNQAYLLEFPCAQTRALGLGCAGTFRSWDWSVADGWVPARDGSGLPAEGGFGCRQDVSALAHHLATAIVDSGEPYLTWSELVQTCPSIEYLLPSDQELLWRVLDTAFGMAISRDMRTRRVQVGPGR